MSPYSSQRNAYMWADIWWYGGTAVSLLVLLVLMVLLGIEGDRKAEQCESLGGVMTRAGCIDRDARIDLNN